MFLTLVLQTLRLSIFRIFLKIFADFFIYAALQVHPRWLHFDIITTFLFCGPNQSGRKFNFTTFGELPWLFSWCFCSSCPCENLTERIRRAKAWSCLLFEVNVVLVRDYVVFFSVPRLQIVSLDWMLDRQILCQPYDCILFGSQHVYLWSKEAIPCTIFFMVSLTWANWCDRNNWFLLVTLTSTFCTSSGIAVDLDGSGCFVRASSVGSLKYIFRAIMTIRSDSPCLGCFIYFFSQLVVAEDCTILTETGSDPNWPDFRLPCLSSSGYRSSRLSWSCAVNWNPVLKFRLLLGLLGCKSSFVYRNQLHFRDCSVTCAQCPWHIDPPKSISHRFLHLLSMFLSRTQSSWQFLK